MTGQEREEALCGFLNVLKPPGMSSAGVVGMVRRFLGGAKIGHGGTLDPEAAGVLPLMVGKATRLFDYMQEKEKAYVAEVAFGCATDTQDAQGTPLAWGEGWPQEAALRAALPRFQGEIWQRPPMYSAIQQEGKRLYELAREGKQAEIPPRRVRVHALGLERMTPGHGALLHVACSKGFYVRTLCHDLGESLGCPAHLRFLLRTRSGVFTLETAHTLEALGDAAREGAIRQCLLPMDAPLGHLPRAQVPQELRKAFFTGGDLPWAGFQELHGTAAEAGEAACLWVDGRLTAIGRRQEDRLKPCTWLGE